MGIHGRVIRGGKVQLSRALPEGAKVSVYLVDQKRGWEYDPTGDDLDEAGREGLHAALEQSDREILEGKTLSEEQVARRMRVFRAKLQEEVRQKAAAKRRADR